MPPSPRRYLLVTGNLPRWHYVVFFVFTGWLLYLRVIGSKPSFAHYVFLLIVPIAAGTGLLTTARAGQLDLLLGAGLSRSQIWRTALIYAWLIPVGMGVVTFALGAGNWRILALRVPAVLCFTGGVAFAAGLIELRYITGIVWILVRFLFVATPTGLTASMQLARGPGLPTTGTMALLLIAAPESALEMRMPIAYVVLIGLLGASFILLSYLVFRRAEFGGKRT